MGSHIKWWQVLKTYLNIWKIVTELKTNSEEMLQHDFQFFENLMIFLIKTVINYFPLSFFFCTFVKIFKPKKKKKKTYYDMCNWIFSITLSHFERITWIFLCTMGALIIYFVKIVFIFNFVGYGLVTKSLGAECTFRI
jgi:hypothetical protein